MTNWPWTRESPLIFSGVHISSWLPMCFTIYRNQSWLASVPWAILRNPSLSPSATLFQDYVSHTPVLQTAAFTNPFPVKRNTGQITRTKLENETENIWKISCLFMWPKEDTTFKFGNYTFLPLRPMRPAILLTSFIFYLGAIQIKTRINPLSCKPTLLPDYLIMILALSSQQRH